MSKTQKGIIAFQGEVGANSHIICQQAYPNMEVLPCDSFDLAFKAVEDGKADLAMIAIENSLAGRVADIHHLLPNSDLKMIAEYFLPIRFHLMALDGVKLEEITDVYSHIVCLPQCRNFIQKHGFKTHVAADTAGSARLVAEWKDGTKAAIAPKIAADIYGLNILAENIEDAAHNTTRFVVFSRQSAKFNADDGPMITSFLFRVRNVPASLYKGLGGFATNGVNMIKLESYQVEGNFSATQFYAEIEGHPDQKSVTLALEELEFFTTNIKIFGTYRRNDYRNNFTSV
ncbi:MAG: prephenate dehydratase [Hyphomicrobiales bacterium]|nr:MAG: prephenate dehydratase [Hyphomicrobiales bacterium]